MDSLFEVHRLNEAGMAKAAAIASCFDGLLIQLKTICPDSTREFSIVKTKLEEAAFFAKKAMAKLPENQEEKIPA
jgi:hypothetical protein